MHTLFSLSLEEIFMKKDLANLLKKLDALLIFGSYPEVVTQRSFGDKIDLLIELTSSNLYIVHIKL